MNTHQQTETAIASQNREQICPNCGHRQDNPPEAYCEDCSWPLQSETPAKPADAHPTGAHTPMAGDSERLLQIGQLTAERDRLKEQNEIYRNALLSADDENKTRREQVNTLRAACKGMLDAYAPRRHEYDEKEWHSAVAKAQAAIIPMEGERP